ncbi:hypothetical protein D1872_310050 [compost metagenome]
MVHFTLLVLEDPKVCCLVRQIYSICLSILVGHANKNHQSLLDLSYYLLIYCDRGPFTTLYHNFHQYCYSILQLLHNQGISLLQFSIHTACRLLIATTAVAGCS